MKESNKKSENKLVGKLKMTNNSIFKNYKNSQTTPKTPKTKFKKIKNYCKDASK